MKNKILILILGMFLISSVSAIDCWGTLKQDTEINLIQQCPSCSYVNITSITYPNGTVFLNEQMQKTGINFNYTLPDSSQEGIVSYGTIGDKNGASPPNYEDLCIQITPTGNMVDTGESIMYIWILIVLAALSILGIYVSVVIPYKNVEEETRDGKIIRAITLTKYAKIITIWITSGIILMFLTILVGMINNYIQFVEMKSLFTSIYTFLNALIYANNRIILIWLMVAIWKDILWNKEIRKNGKAFIEKSARDSR